MGRPFLASLLLAAAAAAQAGDHAGERQAALPADLDIPPAPLRTPEQGLRSFRLQPGFRIEIAAAEPVVEDPVCLSRDAAGRMWVVEMRGFMPDVDDNGEASAVDAEEVRRVRAATRGRRRPWTRQDLRGIK